MKTICSIPKGNLANKLETPIRKDLQQKNKVDIFASVLAGVMAGAVTQSVVAGSGGSVSYISSRSTWTVLDSAATLETGTRKTFQQPLDCV